MADVEKTSTPSIEKTSEDNDGVAALPQVSGSPFNMYTYHEVNAGNLVIDPAEAKAEFGDAVASRLKLTEDGTTILWPQPTDDPDDPQNWTSGRKAMQLFIITFAAMMPDFQSGIGIASLFPLALQFETTTTEINDLTSSWSIFLIGWGGIFAVMLMRRYGRLPVLFWSQLISFAFLIGCTFAPDLKTFAAMRCLNGFFSTCPQVTGLYIITDMYPFHLQARKVNIWTFGFVFSPLLSPFLLGFVVAKTTWRWAYGIGCLVAVVEVLTITFFAEETMYDRTISPVPKPSTTGLRYRIETLVGITGIRMAKYRATWGEAISGPFRVLFRPHLFMALVFEALVFGFAIGVVTTQAVFLAAPEPIGFGLSQLVTAGIYATPLIGVILGELAGRYLNDFIQRWGIRKNKGTFFPEIRLWACYLGIPLYLCGFITLGAGIQDRLSLAAVIMGWGIAQFAMMIITVAIYAYGNDCCPKNRGEVSALITLARTLGGFAVAYFQVPWATKSGALEPLGVEAAIVVAVFLITIPVLQLRGRQMRERYTL